MPQLALEGQVAFISGSTKGIGWSTAQLLAEQGAILILNNHSDPQLLAQCVQLLKDKYNTEAIGISADFSIPAQILDCYRQIVQKFGKIDIVINNAGIMRPALLGMISDELLTSSFNLNTLSVIHSMQAAARLMMRKKSGSIINISSILGVHGAAGQVVYAGTKAAVIGITKSAAKELAPHGIRVNCIAPGFIDTELTAAQSKEIVHSIQMGRIGSPKEVAEAILFFASPASAYVTGQVLGVDGGMIV
jgi:3-oxoacyl-[acyl-carrier protein] reductase